MEFRFLSSLCHARKPLPRTFATPIREGGVRTMTNEHGWLRCGEGWKLSKKVNGEFIYDRQSSLFALNRTS